MCCVTWSAWHRRCLDSGRLSLPWQLISMPPGIKSWVTNPLCIGIEMGSRVPAFKISRQARVIHSMLCGTDCQVQTENSKLQFNAKKTPKICCIDCFQYTGKTGTHFLLNVIVFLCCWHYVTDYCVLIVTQPTWPLSVYFLTTVNGNNTIALSRYYSLRYYNNPCPVKS